MATEPVDRTIEAVPPLADELRQNVARWATRPRQRHRFHSRSDEVIEKLSRTDVVQIPPPTTASPSTLEPHLTQHAVRRIRVELDMTIDEIAELDAEDVEVANRAQFIDQPLQLPGQTRRPVGVE